MADRKVGKRSMGRRGRSKMESGTCNVCSAPCSSCMHRSVGFTGSKSDESSDETCHGVASSQCSANEDDVLRLSRVKTHSTSHTASEVSVLVNASHDAFSENAESKEIIRSSEVSDDSGAVETSSKASSAEIGVKCVKGQEDRTTDDQAKSSISDYPNDRAGKKDSSDSSALVSDPVLGGSNNGSMKVDPCGALLDEAKSQPLPFPSPNHEDGKPSVLKKTKEKLGSENNRGDENINIEGSTHSSQDGKNEKSGKKDQLHRAEEPNSPAMSESGSDGSEMVEHDVKVCDICGDAGREDLLAICSRCSDGAEHTYCMREMLDKVPEGYWLCEECKFSEEAEKQKLAHLKHSETKERRETELNLNAQTSGKRHAEKAEAAPDAKRQAVEAPTGSPKKSILSRIAAVSREPSFKGLDKPKRKLVHQASFANLSSDDAESTRSTVSQLQSPKGAFFKSNSFNANSKPKVKLVDDDVFPRQRTVKEYTSLDLKDGVSRAVGKPMSIRSTEVGCSSNDLKGKMVTSKYHNPQEVKGSKQLKNTSTEANSVPKNDPKLISRKLGSLTSQTSNLTRNRLENPVASAGESSMNEKGSSSEKISSQTSSKDGPPSISELAEGLTSPVSANSEDVVSRSRESRELGEKSKDALINRPRSSLLSGAKGLASQKEGQMAEPNETSCASDSNRSTTRNLREDINKDNRLRAAVNAALRKKPSFGKNRGPEQPDGSSVSNTDSSCDKDSQSQLPLKTAKSSMPLEGPQGGQPNTRPAFDPFKQTIATNGKHHAFSAADAMYSPRSEDLEANFPSIKPFPRDLPLVPTIVPSETSAIPEYGFIWQGDLEVQRSRNLLEMHCGMQAHLSTLASPKVLEVVKKFPEKVPLTEVPRLSTWPAQFRDIGAKEDHIALFFFAKDFESYEKSYKPLVDNMIKKDLALKGNLGGIELLIFASNQLPRHCQRWNMLFFLWGVFRGRKESSSNLTKNPSLPTTSNVLSHDRGPIVTTNQTHSSLKHMEKMSSACESSCSTTVAESKVGVVSHEDRDDKESSIERSSVGSEMNTKDSNLSLRFMASSTQSCPKVGCSSPLDGTASKEDAAAVRSIPLQATITHCGPSDSEKASSGSSEDGCLVKKVQPLEERTIGVSTQEKEEETSGCGENPPLAAIGSGGCSENRENTSDRDLGCGQSGRRKRPFFDLTEPATEDSSDVNERVPLHDLTSGSLCEGSANKKLKFDSQVENECHISGSSSHYDSASRKNDVGPSSMTETGDHLSCEEKIIKKDPDTAERIVFPVDLNDVKEDIEMDEDPIPLCGNRQVHGVVPNLELALGTDEATANVGVLPFLAGATVEYGGQNRPRDQMMSREKHEEDAASLSLSLSFPFLEKEQTQKPGASSSEQERQKNVVNTPLFLFRGFTDKTS